MKDKLLRYQKYFHKFQNWDGSGKYLKTTSGYSSIRWAKTVYVIHSYSDRRELTGGDSHQKSRKNH